MKYLITQEQRELLLNTLSLGELGYGRLGSMVESLKPIEPLSDEAIGLISTEPMFCGCHPDFCRMVVQIVEAHILGERE